MPSKQEIEDLMSWTFPSCPVCRSKGDYLAEGTFTLTVKCKACGIKFQSQEFSSLQSLKDLRIWEIPSDSGYADILGTSKYYRVPKSILFWKTLDLERIAQSNGRRTFPELRYEELMNWSEKDLVAEIQRDIVKLEFFSDQAGLKGVITNVLDIGTLFGSNIAEQRTLFAQLATIIANNIQIRQNELILRKLQQLIDLNNN